jgi:aldehyde:ferredoxin oxidoreductase
LFSASLTTGVAEGARLSRAELREMIRGYYDARQWDEKGFVPESKLNALRIFGDAEEMVDAER